MKSTVTTLHLVIMAKLLSRMPSNSPPNPLSAVCNVRQRVVKITATAVREDRAFYLPSTFGAVNDGFIKQTFSPLSTSHSPHRLIDRRTSSPSQKPPQSRQMNRFISDSFRLKIQNQYRLDVMLERLIDTSALFLLDVDLDDFVFGRY